MKKYCGCALLALALSISTRVPSQETTPQVTFREPFTVKLKFDDKHKVEQKFDRTPFVAEKTVHLFAGEDFGINLQREGDEIVEVRYQRDPKQADVEFTFEVRKIGSHTMMTLTTVNHLEKSLVMDGWMVLPGNSEPVKTSLLPVLPHLVGLETWPQPILKLELRNLRLTAPPVGLEK